MIKSEQSFTAQLLRCALDFLRICIKFSDVQTISEMKGVGNMQITKDTIIGDILDADFDAAPYFLEIGMHCLGCPASRGESIEQACAVHGTDPDELVAKLNAHFANK